MASPPSQPSPILNLRPRHPTAHLAPNRHPPSTILPPCLTPQPSQPPTSRPLPPLGGGLGPAVMEHSPRAWAADPYPKQQQQHPIPAHMLTANQTTQQHISLPNHICHPSHPPNNFKHPPSLPSAQLFRAPTSRPLPPLRRGLGPALIAHSPGFGRRAPSQSSSGTRRAVPGDAAAATNGTAPLAASAAAAFGLDWGGLEQLNIHLEMGWGWGLAVLEWTSDEA